MKILKKIVGMLQTNSYIIINDQNKAAIIDPGADAQILLDAIKQNNAQLEMILLTHGHFDHIGAVKQIKKATGATIYIHQADDEMLGDMQKNAASIMASGNAAFYQDLKADKTFSDGDIIKFGDQEIKIMHTPGHTKGSSMFFVEDTIFSGDTLFKGTVGIINHYGGDKNAQMQSMKKIASLKGDYKIMAGHGSDTTLALELETNVYLGNVGYDTY